MQVAAELNNANKAHGLFEVALWSWDDILDRAEGYPEMRAEALIADGYLAITLALHPKQPANPILTNPVAVSPVSTGAVSLSGDVAATGASTTDLVHETKIDVWRDQIRGARPAQLSVLWKLSSSRSQVRQWLASKAQLAVFA